MAQRSRVAELLIKAAVIDDLQLRSALAHQERWGGRLTQALVELGLADEDEIAAAIALGAGVPRLTLGTLAKDAAALARISVAFAESKGVFPVALKDNGKTLLLAIADPTDLSILDEASGMSRARIQPGVAGEDELARAIAWHYRNIDLPQNPNRARSAVQRSMRHSSDSNPAVPYPTPQTQEFEFSAEALGSTSASVATSSDMLNDMLGESTGAGWTNGDRERLRDLLANQEKSSRVLAALLELLVEKGHLRPSALQAWRRGEHLPPLPQLPPISR